MKKVLLALIVVGALARIGFWLKGGDDEGRYSDQSGSELICNICDDVFSGIGDLCGSCMDIVQKIGRQMKSDM